MWLESAWRKRCARSRNWRSLCAHACRKVANLQQKHKPRGRRHSLCRHAGLGNLCLSIGASVIAFHPAHNDSFPGDP